MDDIKRVETVLTDFIEEFRNNTFDFLYESDIKSKLFSKFFDTFKEIIKAEAKYHKPKNYKEEGFINISRVKTEYPSRKLFDIAILKENSKIYTNELEAILLQNDIFWILPVSIAFQLKYLQLGDSPIQKLKEFIIDIIHLRTDLINSKLDYGYVLFFIQSYDENVLDKLNEVIKKEKEIFHDNLFVRLISPHKVLNIDREGKKNVQS